jgi:hypothetical protein
MTLVIFEGEAPYSMPPAQSGGATARDGIVEMSLLVPVRGYKEIVYVSMTEKAATDLANSLVKAASDARVQRQQS